ncbi:MAG: CPBP family intramembrane metalloprotease [Parafilimonas sp.]|nr:CPBP family intramembrane metalloprotease [Parafilimonas sp.]
MLDYNYQRPRYTAWSQFAILLTLCGFGLLLGGMISIKIASAYLHVTAHNLEDAISKPGNAHIAILFQFISTFLFMAVPAFVFARIMNRNAFKYIGFNAAISGKQVFVIIGIVLVCIILSGALSMLNQIIPLSKSLEAYFKTKEQEYDKVVTGMAQMKTTSQYILSLIVIALMPAIFEEMLFRGALQPVMISLTKNVFIGIFLTGILFSAMHGSYYGFLPRLALGVIIGYIYYTSKNLWLSVCAHFLYNAIGITQMYAAIKQGSLNSDTVSNDVLPVYYGIIAAAALYWLFIFFKKESNVVISIYNQEQKPEIYTDQEDKNTYP